MDARTIKTKSSINEAFISLLSENSFDKITVQKICERAGVNRVTFYNHYEDKYDLFVEYLDNTIIKLFEDSNNQYDIKEDPTNFFKTLFYNIASLCYDKKNLLKAVERDQNSLVVYILQRKANENVLKLIEYKYKPEELKYSPISIASFLTGGFSNLLIHYISDDRVQFEALINEANKIIEDMLTVVIKSK